MAFTVSYIVGSPFSTNDISNYVIENPNIPIYKGNDNFAPVVHSINIILSQTCPYTIAVGEQIRVTGPTTTQYFEIKKVKTEKTMRTISVYCEHRLCRLRDHYLTSAALDTLITTTADANKYIANDNRGGVYNYANAQVLWIIEKMFYVAGISNYLLTDKTDTAITLDAINFTFEEIVIDYKMFYAINQSSTDTIEGASLITFWDFIQAVCSFWGFTFYEYNGQILMLAKDTLTLVESNIGYSDNIVLGYEETESENKNITALCDIYWAGSIDAYYAGADAICGTNLNTDVANEPSFTWLTNLRFLLRDASGADGDVYGNGGGTVYVDFLTNYSGLANNMIKQSIENNYIEKSYDLVANTELLADKYYATEVSIDIANQTLKVVYRDFT